MRDKDAQLMMEALRGNSSIVPSRLGIIPEKHYFIMYDWLGHFLKYLGNEKSAPANTHSDAIVAEDPGEHYQVEWLDGMPDGRSVHTEPQTIWVYSAEAGTAKYPTQITTPSGNVYPEPPTEPGELVGVGSGDGGILVTKLIVLDNMQQYRELGYDKATKNDILPQNPEDIARQAERMA